MIRKKKPKSLIVLALQWLSITLVSGMLSTSCVYDFKPKNLTEKEDIIVIEGDIIAGGYSHISISTTLALSAKEDPKYITKATVWVESESGEIFNAAYDGNANGIFTTNTTDIDIHKKYKLCVEIPGRGSYQSSLIPVLQSPIIDSLTYAIGQDNQSVQIEVTSHSNHPINKYYKWIYYEDWEFNVIHMPLLRYNEAKNSLEPIPIEDFGKRYYCWENNHSTGIHIATTEKLSQNIIYKQPLNTINHKDRRISLLYSVLVSQIALTQQGYIYWDILKKNTDETGGIFAPQPSEMRGNLESITNPKEPVIGFISASTIAQKRLFLSNQQLHIYKNYTACQLDTISRNEWRLAAAAGKEVVEDMPPLGSAVWITSWCADCVKAGGSKNKPPFWPNNHQ